MLQIQKTQYKLKLTPAQKSVLEHWLGVCSKEIQGKMKNAIANRS